MTAATPVHVAGPDDNQDNAKPRKSVTKVTAHTHTHTGGLKVFACPKGLHMQNLCLTAQHFTEGCIFSVMQLIIAQAKKNRALSRVAARGRSFLVDGLGLQVRQAMQSILFTIIFTIMKILKASGALLAGSSLTQVWCF